MIVIPMYQVDAFTDKLFGGNPAAVCPLEEWIDDDLMQKIAMENNLSETAFFVKKDGYYEIRWFTPEVEIDLAGHPTLATAHVIYNHLNYEKEKIIFHSKSGELTVTRDIDIIRLNFPSREPVKVDIPELLVDGLGIKPLEVLKSRDLLALFSNEKEIRDIRPNLNILEKLEAFGIIITAKGDDSDFVSRYFAPWAGINEDPVTGSAHSTLIPYWAKRLNKDNLLAYQISKRRGELFCRYLGDRVEIGGRAVTFMIGEIYV